MRMEEQLTTTNSIDLRTDTFDILSYTINAAFLNYQTDQKIDASTVLDIDVLETATSISLDLLELNVSEVKIDGATVSFTYNSPKIHIPVSVLRGQNIKVEISYSGTPQSDSQWGGFYFRNEYAYNLGVGFAADPHNFGRVWFPCFDNFVDRAEYYMNVTVDSGYRAYGNGYLTEVVNNGNSTRTFKWTMDEPIPTYLAAVAIAPYEEVKFDVDGIPVLLTAVEADTANLRSSFRNIPSCIRSFESLYGDHTFDRIGFNIVPFNAGAMEHATNIAYPRYAIAGGGLDFETLYAHELAHHWWGNTITCRTQEDMWLNEGWASYSENIFLEEVYGRAKYDEEVEANHRQVLQFAHVQDGAILPVSGVSHANTYGRHVYNKGGDMVHTLRGMMGDDKFFEACKSFQAKFRFKDVSTDDMKNHFQDYSSFDISGFFDQWVKTAGFPHFDILRARKEGDSYSVTIKQTPRFNEEVYKGVVVTLSAFGSDFTRFDQQIVINESEQVFLVDCPFEPEFWSFDFDDLISDAVTTDWAFLENEEEIDMEHGMLNNVKVTTSQDSILLRVDHHWAPADGTYGGPVGAQLSRQRYWTIDGVWDENTEIAAELIYSGLITNSPTFGYLDNELIRITEDSLVLLYRPHAKAPWAEAKDYTKDAGSLFDKRGTMEISKLKKGQYTLAMYDANLASTLELEVSPSFKVYPNPASKEITVELGDRKSVDTIEITDLTGRVVQTVEVKPNTKKEVVDISKLTSGVYFVGVISKGLAYDLQKIRVD